MKTPCVSDAFIYLMDYHPQDVSAKDNDIPDVRHSPGWWHHEDKRWKTSTPDVLIQPRSRKLHLVGGRDPVRHFHNLVCRCIGSIRSTPASHLIVGKFLNFSTTLLKGRNNPLWDLLFLFKGNIHDHNHMNVNSSRISWGDSFIIFESRYFEPFPSIVFLELLSS